MKFLKGRSKVLSLFLFLISLMGGYLIIAWASYSELDNAWSVASNVSQTVFNRTGSLGAWWIDLFYALFGRVAFLLPLLICFVPLYFLIFNPPFALSWRNLATRLASLSMLVVGLAGIADALFPNTAIYRAGGAIGGMLLNGFSFLGTIGGLLIALLLAVAGFYFSSGQTLIKLASQFMRWLTDPREDLAPKSAENPQNEREQAVSSTQISSPILAENPPLANEGKFQAPPLDQAMTDTSIFPRPRISGLRPSPTPETTAETVEPTEPVPPAVQNKTNPPTFNVPTFQPEHLTNVSQFRVENPTPLPTVNVPPIEPLAVATPIEPEAEKPFVSTAQPEPTLPTIRLKPRGDDPLASELGIEPRSSVAMATETVAEQPFQINLPAEEPRTSSPIVETPAPTVAVPPLKVELPTIQPVAEVATAVETTKVAETATAPRVQPEVAPKVNLTASQPTEPVQKPAPHYPNGGYGDSFIHPLLQGKTTVEKPTTPLPTLDLLDSVPPQTQQVTEAEILETSRRIEDALSNFGIKATVEDVLIGPVVTRYEIKPAAGVKASKIMGLAGDLARELVFKAIRITEVVPGKPFMGIETPNKQRETVWLRDVIDSDAFRNSKAILPMALGKDISGEPIVVDMAKMPHLLVAGQTGGGKSVGVNTMILSLLFKLSPEQVRFIMIDPKVVELSIYNDIPHLLTPVVTDMKKAENALRWAVDEMERRYQLVSHLKVRNIEGYNEKIDQAAEMNLPIPDPTWRPGDSMDKMPPPLEKLSYIVLIVDEFADLMMSAGKQVEAHIMRIAQKARAVGIHLILATQRPSTDVITGVIKANIPSRIAFTVASQIDSRTILDSGGAEALLGRGDMLYSESGSPDIIRVHGAFMKDDEVQRIADNWRARGKPNYLDGILDSPDDEMDDDARPNVGGDLDPLFDEITAFVVESNVTSISGIQRRFQLGFNRAARIIDQLEAQGIISPPDSRNKREVLAR
ncbi:cell division protein FtsK [Haemophilus paracuniculus]|uniref:DNA translocase FtsK n=1 Tax=Haemophilus paracuniculus TaxID=734 RepID=A0A1T0AS91_9PAST|nr:DNA translocase FtsK [Haemophilus paracuniculus]OOR99151.1 cell division protein FtsK [Haemophilus paracuniculus]